MPIIPLFPVNVEFLRYNGFSWQYSSVIRHNNMVFLYTEHTVGRYYYPVTSFECQEFDCYHYNILFTTQFFHFIFSCNNFICLKSKVSPYNNKRTICYLKILYWRFHSCVFLVQFMVQLFLKVSLSMLHEQRLHPFWVSNNPLFLKYLKLMQLHNLNLYVVTKKS